jgi:hypothetical protein
MIDMDGYVMSKMLQDFHDGHCRDELNNCSAFDLMDVAIGADILKRAKKLQDENKGLLRKCFDDIEGVRE